MGGEYYTHTGGGVNYLCLPHNPKYDRYSDGNQDTGYVFGTEHVVGSLIENVDVRKSSPLFSLKLSLETVLIITFLESTAT